VGFHTSLCAAHRRSCFNCIQSFPVTQQEGFALTCRKFAQCLFDERDELFLLQGYVRRGRDALIFAVLKHIQRVEFLFLVSGLQAGKQGNQADRTFCLRK